MEIKGEGRRGKNKREGEERGRRRLAVTAEGTGKSLNRTAN